MSLSQYVCDACGADFEVDLDQAKALGGVFCPECGETELIKPIADETCCSDNTTPAKPIRR